MDVGVPRVAVADPSGLAPAHSSGEPGAVEAVAVPLGAGVVGGEVLVAVGLVAAGTTAD